MGVARITRMGALIVRILGTLIWCWSVSVRGRSLMNRRTGPTAATVELVWVRDGGRCARCGTGLHRENRGMSWSVHHRRPRGMGGSGGAWVNEAANLILLCGSGVTGCHSWVETHRAEARDLGWLIPANAVYTSHDVAVPYWDGLFYLTDYGTREPEKPLPY